MVNWIKKRMKERTSWDGAVCVALGLMISIFNTNSKDLTWTCNRIWCLDYLEIRITERYIMVEEKKNGVVVKDDHNEFELMLRFFGNEILAIKLAASNFNGKLIMWAIVIMLFTFVLMEVFWF